MANSVKDAQAYHQNMVHYLPPVDLVFGDGTVTIGWIPPGARVLHYFAHVSTAFDAGGDNSLDVGWKNAGSVTTDADGIENGSAAQLDSVGGKHAFSDRIAAFPDGAEITATYTKTGTAPTAGALEVGVAYTVDNED